MIQLLVQGGTEACGRPGMLVWQARPGGSRINRLPFSARCDVICAFDPVLYKRVAVRVDL